MDRKPCKGFEQRNHDLTHIKIVMGQGQQQGGKIRSYYYNPERILFPWATTDSNKGGRIESGS